MGCKWLWNKHTNLNKKTLLKVEKEQNYSRIGRTLFSTNNNEFLMSKDKGYFYQFDYQSMIFKLLFSFPNPMEIVNFKKYGNFLWILTEKDGLLKLNLKTLKIEKTYTFFCQKEGDMQLSLSRDFLMDKNGYIWIATHQCLYLLNPKNGEYILYKHSDTDKFSLINNSIWNLNLDKQGNLWIGTFCGGVCYVNLNDLKGFKTITVQSSKFSQNIISGFAERGNELWIGTEGSGMLCYDIIKGVSKSYKHDPKNNSLAFDNVKAMLMDRIHNKLWIGMFLGGLDCLDLTTNKFKNYSENDEDKRILVNHVNRLEAEADSGIWVGYRDGKARITYFSITRKTSKHINFNSKEYHNFIGSRVSDFCRDDENNLWFASQERLNVMDIKTKKFMLFKLIHLIIAI